MTVRVSYLQWHIVQCARFSSVNKRSLYHPGSITASTLSSFQEDSVYRSKCLVYIYYLHEKFFFSFIVKNLLCTLSILYTLLYGQHDGSLVHCSYFPIVTE